MPSEDSWKPFKASSTEAVSPPPLTTSKTARPRSSYIFGAFAFFMASSKPLLIPWIEASMFASSISRAVLTIVIPSFSTMSLVFAAASYRLTPIFFARTSSSAPDLPLIFLSNSIRFVCWSLISPAAASLSGSSLPSFERPAPLSLLIDFISLSEIIPLKAGSLFISFRRSKSLLCCFLRLLPVSQPIPPPIALPIPEPAIPPISAPAPAPTSVPTPGTNEPIAAP